MAITPHLLGNKEAFESELKSFFVKVEANKEQVYADIKGVPTVGIGYALIQEIKGVWEIRANLETQMDAIGKTVSADDRAALQKIADALNKGTTEGINTAKSLADSSFSFEPMTSDEAKNLVVRVVNDEYIQAMRNRLGATLYDSLANSKEMVALLSIVYQGWTGAIKQPLIDALSNGNRAEAWYQIRYAMNTSNAGWLANRRYKESDIFGLWNNESNITTQEIETLVNFLKQQAPNKSISVLQDMRNYEIQFKPNAVNTRTIDEQINEETAVKNYFVSKYGQGQTIDGNVILGTELANNVSPLTRSLTKDEIKKGYLKSTDKNDLIFGEKGDDVLKGGTGSDVIYGGEGNDTITGEAGIDTLIGGNGVDTYYADEGDTIRDSDGQGEVYLNGKKLTFATRKKGEDFWTDSQGNVYRLNGTTLEVNDPLKIENFKNKDLGIYLDAKDDPEDPPIPPIYNPNNSSTIIIRRWDPLVLDLDGNGQIDAVASTASTTYFDFNGVGDQDPNNLNDIIYDIEIIMRRAA